MNQAAALYIFVTSDIPDVYINTIGYCIEHFDLSKVVLLGIVKDKGQKGSTETHLQSVKGRIAKQLSLLQKGEYLYKDQKSKQWQEKQIDIESHDKIRYTRVAAQHIDTDTIVYSTLESKIVSFLEGNNYNCIFDVSAISKGYLVDVFVILLSKKVEDIYTFELKLRERTYDERELIHNLSIDNGDYEFVNLTKSDYTRDKAVKTKHEESVTEHSWQMLDEAVDVVSSDFATTILTIYTVFVIASFVLIAIFVAQADWSKIEPWTFILFGVPLLPYLLSLIMQLIFRKELSLRPQNIFDWLKNYKSRVLRNKLVLLQNPISQTPNSVTKM